MDAETLRGRSVEAYWPPLTPEHGFPSLYPHGPGRSPSAGHVPPFKKVQQKTGDTKCGISCKKPILLSQTTSYGGIIRIRLKGRKSHFPLSPFTSSPVFCCCHYYIPTGSRMQVFFHETTNSLPLGKHPFITECNFILPCPLQTIVIWASRFAPY